MDMAPGRQGHAQAEEPGHEDTVRRDFDGPLRRLVEQAAGHDLVKDREHGDEQQEAGKDADGGRDSV